MATGEVTGAVSEDGAVVIKGEDGSETRYVKESDLLTVKGSKENIEKAVREAEAARDAATKDANEKVETAHQKVLQAEARVSSLEEQAKQGGATVEELANAKQALETAKKSGEELGSKFLELRRSVIVSAYGVPKETVESKSLEELDTFEEALKAVVGSKGLGNYAVGGGGGGANALEGKSPMELAQLAYSESK
jgi:DNA repair exonuclease SbcCD ATPase subunit